MAQAGKQHITTKDELSAENVLDVALMNAKGILSVLTESLSPIVDDDKSVPWSAEALFLTLGVVWKCVDDAQEAIKVWDSALRARVSSERTSLQ